MMADDEQRKLALELAVIGREHRGASALQVVVDAEIYADFLAGEQPKPLAGRTDQS